MISMEEVRPLLRTKLLPFLQQMDNLQEIFIGNVFIPAGSEQVIHELIQDCGNIKCTWPRYLE